MHPSKEYRWNDKDGCDEAESVDSWCLVSQPPMIQNANTKNQKVDESVQKANATSQRVDESIQKVTAWMTKHSSIPNTNMSASAPLVRRQSAGDVSLADFLRCASPYRPSFMDKPRNRSPRAGALKQSDKPSTVSRTRSEDFRRRRNNLVRSLVDREPVEAVASAGDAEFLSHALCHFVAFQPLDFTPYTPQPSPADLDEARQKDSDGHLWSFITGMFDDYSHNITFY
ncbi:hypothetical protein LPJ59_002578 [Coemansia sp. RSA 2399]|nr:hypothetical protein LPJ59_002578 [Coemansia sp. RSA 2399]